MILSAEGRGEQKGGAACTLRRGFRSISGMLLLLLMSAQTPAQQLQAAQVASEGTTPKIIPYTPQLRMKDLQSAKGTDKVALKGKGQISVNDLRRLEAFQKRLSAAKSSSKHTALQYKPQPNSIKASISSASDLSAALKRPDSDTVKLPSGKIVTVGMLRFAQPMAEQKLGYKLEQLQKRPDLSGRALKVSASEQQAYWENIFKKADNTVLESSKGERITVGELKAYFADINAMKSSTEPGSKRGRQ